MPLFQYIDNSPEGKKRQALIKEVLPKVPIVDSFLQPRLMEAMDDVLIKSLKQEIEIYKAYPKPGQYNPETFDTRSNDTCFMGQGFRANGFGVEGWSDAELSDYRKAIGMISHTEWGGCTLMEIWGADHYKDYKEMVEGVMQYTWGKRKTMPELHFYINPFFKNPASGQMILSVRQQEDSENAKHLMKLASYIEIRDRLERAGEKNPLNLGLTKEEDPKPSKRSKIRRGEDDE